MNREYVGVSESDDLVEVVEVMLREDAETAVVQRGSEHVGVLTERDVLALLVEGPAPEEATVGDAMTESVPTVSPETTLDAAADEMSALSSGRLVVTNGAEPLGVITERDLLASRTYGSSSGVSAPGQDEPGGSDVTMAADQEGATVEVEATEFRGQSSGDEFRDQSICEACGKLSSDLASFNGQLLCTECRDM